MEQKERKEEGTLTVFEELLLMAIDDERGGVADSLRGSLRFGLAGAVLAELTLQGKVKIEDHRLAPVDPRPTGNPMMDEAMTLISASHKPRKPLVWIHTLGDRKLKKQTARLLAEKNILRIEEKRYFWVIPYELYPQQPASAKFWVKQHLRSIVLGGAEPETRRIVLLSLLDACNLLSLVFTKDERKAATERVRELVKDEVFGDMVIQTLEEIGNASTEAIYQMPG